MIENNTLSLSVYPAGEAQTKSHASSSESHRECTSLLEFVDTSSLILELNGLSESILERDKLALRLASRVVTVADVDGAGLLLLSTND